VSRRDSPHSARAWGRRQLYSFFSSLGALVSHRLGTLMTALVLGIAMLLPLGLFVTVDNLRSLDLQTQDWGTITVFLQPGVNEEQALALAARIGQEQGAEVVAVSPDQGLQEFQQASGFGQALELFEENPLPWVLQVTLRPSDEQGGEDWIGGQRVREDQVRDLGEWLGGQGGVDSVQVDYKWLRRLAGLLALGDAFVTVLTVLFSLAVVVVVANTIRLDVANRAHEIEVLHLVGASNGFVRQPFLYLGFWYGLLGALLALLLLSLCMVYLAQPIEGLLEAYGNTFRVRGLGAREGILVLLAGGALGLLGAWVSVQRYLRQFRLGESRGRG
jgi:cell division transport system permease protein